MNKNRGQFVVLCGLDGAGKSVIQEYLNNESIKENIRIINAKHPPKEWYENPKIKATYLDGLGETMEDIEEVKYTTSLRIKDQNENILPEIMKGNMVLSHRYIFSLFTYYYAKRSLDMSDVIRFSRGIISPDLTLYFKISSDEFYRRTSEKHLLSYQKSKKFIDKMLDCYDILSSSLDFKVINTEKTTIEKTIELCNHYIKNIEPDGPIKMLDNKLSEIKWD